ncbi:polysaccharide biosynthesis protein, partial [Patescibacteria group bacterium]|nr:polysaccharide biosynthesis protein [Patescibacteria group bacterium]
MDKNIFKNSTILITGGTGSWGHELVTQLLKKYEPKEIRIYSRGEHKQVEMRREFSKFKELKFIIGDVRDKN